MDSYHAGNAFYVDEDYEAAAESYSLAEKTLPSFAPLFSSRAAAYLKLKKHNQALQDCNTALRLLPDMETAMYRKGLVCFELEEFETAKKSFQVCVGLLNKTKDATVLQRWIRKCDLEIAELDEASAPYSTTTTSTAKASSQPSTSSAASTSSQGAAPKAAAAAAAVPSVVPTAPIKYQYYQSAECLNISILAKGLLPTEAQIVIESDHLRVVCKGEVVIDKLLFAYINTLKSSYDIRKTKIEIVLCKEEQGIWPTIEGDASARPRVVKSDSALSGSEGEAATSSGSASASGTGSAALPEQKRPKAYSSAKDWDAVGNEISRELDAEKPEGEEALQKLFKDIYSKADPATQRAMNKSFQTSGGTVLSTNWGEVSQKNYEEERQAPKGVEWKNWEGKKLKQMEDK